MIHAKVKLASPIASVRVADPDRADESARAAAAEQQRRALAEALAGERAELAQGRQAIEAALREAIALRDSVVDAAEAHIVELALDVARKVLMQEIQAKRYEIDPIVRAALDQVSNWREVVVHLSPDDFLRCSLADESNDETQGVRFVADPAVKPAECFLETAEGIVRSDVEEHLSEIATALADPEQAS